MLYRGEGLAFIDETSFNLWQPPLYARKTWQHRDQPISHSVNTTRLSNITIYGMCSNVLPKVYFMLGTSTNSD